MLSADDRVEFLNPAAEGLLGRSSATVLGESVDSLFAAAPWIIDLKTRLAETADMPVRGAGQLDTSPPRDLLAVASNLRDRDGNHVGTVIALHDLAARQRLLREEEERTRLAELDGMLARVAHELNNPLSGIRGAAQLLSKKLPDNDDANEYSEMIVRQADRMSALIDSMLSLEAPAPPMAAVNIHRVLTEVLLLESAHFEERGITIVTEFDPSLPDVIGDSDQLQQVFLNLLKNATAACPPDGGTIIIATRMETTFYLDLGTEKRHYITVEVSDSGAGLDDETLEHMFSPFYSRTDGGHGLGLSIAHNIVTAHQGRIRASNNGNGGACLRVTLPVAEQTNGS